MATRKSKNSGQLDPTTKGVLLVAAAAGVIWVTDQAPIWWEAQAVPWLDAHRPQLAALAAAAAALLIMTAWTRAKGRPQRRVQRRVTQRQPESPKAKTKIVPKPTVDPKTGATTQIILPYPLGIEPSRAEIQEAAKVQGRAEWGDTAQAEVRTNRRSGQTEVVLTPPAVEPERDRVERDLEVIAKLALAQVSEVRIDRRDRAGNPERVVVRHDASFRALTDDVTAEQIERALVSKLGWEPYTYRMTWDPIADVAILERWTDPLARPQKAIPYLPVDQVDLAALPIGLREDGAPALLNLTGGRHTLLAGATGSGKSSLAQSAIRAGAPAVHAGWLQYRGIDPKGGAELGKARPLFYDLAAGPVLSKGPAARFQPAAGGNLLEVEYQRQLDLLMRAGYDLLMRAYRLGAQGVRQHVPSVEEPAIIVWLDEIALMTTYLGTKQEREMASMAIAAIVTQGRAWHVHLVGALQDPRMKTLEIRNLFPVKYGLRLDRKSEVSMVLGDTAVADGARCHKINKLTPGIFYVVEDGGPVPVRGRAAYVADADIDDMCRRFPAPAWEPPPPIGDIGFEEAVASMVDPDAVKDINNTLSAAAGEAAATKPARKRPAKKRPAKKPAAGPAVEGREVVSHDPVPADRVERGWWLSLYDPETGDRRHVQVDLVIVDDDEDTVTLAGDNWEKVYPCTEVVQRLRFADDDD